jgi:hypothetical protein
MTRPAMAPVADCEVRTVVLAVLPRNAISWTLRPPILQHFERVNFRGEIRAAGSRCRGSFHHWLGAGRRVEAPFLVNTAGDGLESLL